MLGKQAVLKARSASELQETEQISALLVHPGADSQTLYYIRGLGELWACPGGGPPVLPIILGSLLTPSAREPQLGPVLPPGHRIPPPLSLHSSPRPHSSSVVPDAPLGVKLILLSQLLPGKCVCLTDITLLHSQYILDEVTFKDQHMVTFSKYSIGI